MTVPDSTTSAPAPVASTRHTLILVAVLAAIAVAGASQTSSGTGSLTSGERMTLYCSVVLAQIGLVALVRRGTRRAGVSLRDVIGGESNALAIARDVLFGLATWAAWEAFSRLALAPVRERSASLDPLLPTTTLEIATWVAVSVFAGIGEELVFRGYLQRQLGALLRSRGAGIALQAMIFGAVHAYQGAWRAATAVAIGLLYGVVTRASGSARAAMVAHACTDVFGGVVLRG